jgi:hypothetical protein
MPLQKVARVRVPKLVRATPQTRSVACSVELQGRPAGEPLGRLRRREYQSLFGPASMSFSVRSFGSPFRRRLILYRVHCPAAGGIDATGPGGGAATMVELTGRLAMRASTSALAAGRIVSPQPVSVTATAREPSVRVRFMRPSLQSEATYPQESIHLVMISSAYRCRSRASRRYGREETERANEPRAEPMRTCRNVVEAHRRSKHPVDSAGA